ncbi:aspartate aminotransferase family protein [Zongyangia hominis]|uniref:Acetylornithine aminotransferase n=1 Tax=Zongyangia hominis TaxID=2763677 RepID=A0A926EES7_9FIRM|nr:aspartate aminotransferase family protein [Zongyangia hominis]MBC8570551.1 aspartate aminotransferase family protein [Zongyangia hominis]
MKGDLIKAADQQYLAPIYNRFDAVLDHGKGAVCYALDGKEYIDFTAGIGVNSLGFCDEGWVKAVTEQLQKIQHTSNLYYTQPDTQVAENLCRRSGMEKVFFANSGAEANEGAIKVARKYGVDHYEGKRYKIITLVNSFHGRTVTTLTATGQEVFHKNFGPFTEGFDYALAGDMDDLRQKADDTTVAVMVEMIQGEGGVVPLSESYVKELSAFCEERDILFMVDEVQTGVGRTGKFFAYEYFDVKPDVVTLAKGLGGGLPIGAVLLGKKAADVLHYSDHGTTFGGNPVACAGAVEILKRIDDSFLEEVRMKGIHITDRVKKMPCVTGITGRGLMLGISLKEGLASVDILKECLAKGLLLLTAKTKLRMLPPLNISFEDIDKGLDILEQVLSSHE